MGREEEGSGEGTSTPTLQRRKRSQRSSQVGKGAQNCGCPVDIIALFLWLVSRSCLWIRVSI